MAYFKRVFCYIDLGIKSYFIKKFMPSIVYAIETANYEKVGIYCSYNLI